MLKAKIIQKILNGIIIYEGIMLISIIPPVSRFVGTANKIAHSSIVKVNNIIDTMINVATRHTFGFSNLYFLALLLIAIGLPVLDVLLKSKESGVN